MPTLALLPTLCIYGKTCYFYYKLCLEDTFCDNQFDPLVSLCNLQKWTVLEQIFYCNLCKMSCTFRRISPCTDKMYLRTLSSNVESIGSLSSKDYLQIKKGKLTKTYLTLFFCCLQMVTVNISRIQLFYFKLQRTFLVLIYLIKLPDSVS